MIFPNHKKWKKWGQQADVNAAKQQARMKPVYGKPICLGKPT